MRLVLSLLLLASVALPARAEELRESRYGPRSQRVETAARADYTGPTLNWAGKAAAPAPDAQDPRANGRPAPVAAWAGYASAAPAPQRTVPAYAPPAPQIAPQAAPQTYAPAAQALPTSLYSPPVASAPIPPAAPFAPRELAGGPPAQTPQPQAQTTTYAANARAPDGLAPRTYSVGRMFGLTPDRIEAPGPPNTVLMAVDPAAVATAPADDGEADHGSAAWLAEAAQEAGRDAPTKKKKTAEESDL
jgi:Meckel syndrome type 1 protein